MKKLKVGLIGTGGIGNLFHLPAWATNKDTEIVALCDINNERLMNAARVYDVKKTFTDYMDLLAVEEIDIVDICTPNYLHSIITVEALKRGKHVFCEKPDAISSEEAMKMKKASEEAGKILMVMRNNRFMKNSKFLKRYIEEGNFGEIYAVRCGWERRRGIPGKGGWFTTKAQSGGGALIDLGVHMVDLAVWLMGSPKPVSVVGSTYNKFSSNMAMADSEHASFGEAKNEGTFDVEDMARGFIKFDNGASLTLEISWASNIEKQDIYYELLGTKAGAKWHSDDGVLKIFGEINGSTVDLIPNVGPEASNEHQANIDHFVDCIIQGISPIFTPEQGVNIIKILEAIYHSAITGKEVQL